jgi:hypothetical protein
VSVDDALRSAVGVLRRAPGSLLPYYAFRAGAADVARLPLLIGLVVALLALSTSGRLGPVVDELAGVNPELLAPETPTGLPAATGQRLVERVATPTVVGALLISGVAALVVGVVARAVTRAASFAAVTAALTDDASLAAGVDGMGRWRTFAGLVLVRWGLLVVAASPVLLAAVGGLTALGTTPSTATRALDQQAVVAVLALVAGAVVTVGAVLVVLALLAFAEPAAVVEGVGVRTAVRRSVGVPFAHPGGFVFYAVVVVGGYLALGVGSVVLGVAGVGRLVALGSAFLLAPVLDSLAVALYLGWVDERGATGDGTDANGWGVDLSADPDPSTNDRWTASDAVADSETEGGGERASDAPSGWSRLRGAVGAGLRELAGFLRHDWPYVAVAASVLGVGVVGGWRATAGYDVGIPTPTDPALVFGAVPVGPFVDIAANNWLVATTAVFSGLFAGAPTVGTLVFNGLLIGGVAGVVDPAVFVAFVAPHGVVELPAIAVAGGVGLRLGHVAWGAWRGGRSRAALADEIGRAWRVVVGLFAVFVVAGFVEAFVTPQVAAAVLG